MAELQLGLQREGSEHGRRATSTPSSLCEVQLCISVQRADMYNLAFVTTREPYAFNSMNQSRGISILS